ncbi:MAG TPA: flagellar hook-basal body complex protein [Solirubrobacteraceae bacterium]|jgi:flagellar hook protein FlgE|nr:flagellar hook-basal body complex protein [Solirubrobacteraceae bacterium]
MFSAISGLQVHQTMLDVAANDIANVNTVGFKGESTTFKDALSQLQRGAAGPSTGLGGTNAIQIGLGVALGGIGNDMGAGAMQQTGNPLDLAIQGDGFFRVGPSSVIGSGAGYSYTRAGNFGLDSAGNLVTADGSFVIGYKYDSGTATFPVSTANETKITVPAGGKDVTIGSDGVVSYVDATGTVQKLAQISMAKFPNAAGLERISGNLYAQSNNSGAPANAVAGDATTGMGTLASGEVEMSNVDLAKEFTTMITAQRGYEANSRVISMADEVLQNLVNIGR